MRNWYDYLRQHATAHTLRPGGPVYVRGEVVAVCEAPQVCIRAADGTQTWWRIDLCTFTAPEAENATDRRPPKPSPAPVSMPILSVALDDGTELVARATTRMEGWE